MRNPFKFGCLKPRTTDDDDSLLRYPRLHDDKGGGFNGLRGDATSSTRWQTPPLGKGARQHNQAFQGSPGSKIPAYHQRELPWCGQCSSRAETLELAVSQIQAELEACKKSQGILKVTLSVISETTSTKRTSISRQATLL
ncbi:hypothetical protein ABBQ38_000535 [Trebouxia sp. C0009 RCD-2024]